MKHELGTFTFDKSELRAIAQFVGTGRVGTERLAVVHFDPPAGSAVATDGHTIAVVKNGTTADKSVFSATMVFIKQCLSLLQKKTDEVSISFDGERISACSSSGLVVQGIPHAASFPDYKLFSSSPGHISDGPEVRVGVFGFNAEYLSRMSLIQKAAGNRCVHQFLGTAALDPCRFVCDSSARNCEWTAVFMPVRL
jgi:hypothetical protein